MAYFADVVLEYFDSGAGPIPGPYGVTFGEDGPSDVGPISSNAVLGSDPAYEQPGFNFLSLPTGSYITVGFNTGYIINGPGNDIFIQEIGASSDRAEVWVSTSANPTATDFVFLGIAQDDTTTSLDLSAIGLNDPVRAIKIIGKDNLGDSPGFDVVNVQVLQVQTPNGDRILTGTDASESVMGSNGNDTLLGNRGDDSLVGGAGNDSMDGGEDNDTLIGNAGVDICTGGYGADQFVFNLNARFNRTLMGVDQITDFTKGEDKIALSKTTFRGVKRITFETVKNQKQAQLSDATFTYIRKTGVLSYNQNGDKAGFGSGGQFADLTNGLNLAVRDLVLTQ